MLKFTEQDKKIGKKIFEKFKKGNEIDPQWFLLRFNKLFKLLNNKEGQLIKRILSIDPKEYGLKLPFWGIKPIPKNLVMIKNQQYKLGKEIKTIRPQFLPKNVFLAYQCLNNAMKKDINRSLNIFSGYRSPAYQLVVFFCNLYFNNWNIKKTLKSALLPGHSEHGYPERQAIDIKLQKGAVEKKDFYKTLYKTKEYKWLLKNGSKFDFYLSYPKNNKLGIIFEPWHWHFKKKNDAKN